MEDLYDAADALERAPRWRVAQDWDAVMRRNTPAADEARMMPEEYRQWMRNLTDQELDLYLKFRVTDAIPFAEVEAEAKRRKIR
jgi:hypothetical protein